jgi:hypothetical protein
MSSRSTQSSSESWTWFCSECVKQLEDTINGSQVKIFWVDDSEYYEGWVAGLDQVSHEHRIKYGDGEWEFVRINREDFLISVTPEDLEKFRKMVSDQNESDSVPLVVKTEIQETIYSNTSGETPARGKRTRRSTPRK